MLNLLERNVIFSVKPQYAGKIITGEKSVELRRRFANEAVIGAVAFIYSTAPEQAIVGYARIADVRRMPIHELWKAYGRLACISRLEFEHYFHGAHEGYAILLAGPIAFAEPIRIDDLERRFGFSPPQSYRYATGEFRELIA